MHARFIKIEKLKSFKKKKKKQSGCLGVLEFPLWSKNVKYSFK